MSDFNQPTESQLNSPMFIYSYVNKLINEIKHVPKESREVVGFHQEMAQRHSSFFSKYPRLFSVIMDDGSNFDMVQLQSMLSSLTQIQSGQKNYEDVNKEYGQAYFDKYVAPHIDMSKEKK